MTLRRLVVDFKPEGVQLRTLYKRKAGPGPGTKTRARETAALARTGLEQALAALEGPVEMVGTAGFETREDTLALAPAPPFGPGLTNIRETSEEES
jgi:hypothetical protein